MRRSAFPPRLASAGTLSHPPLFLLCALAACALAASTREGARARARPRSLALCPRDRTCSGGCGWCSHGGLAYSRVTSLTVLAQRFRVAFPQGCELEYRCNVSPSRNCSFGSFPTPSTCGVVFCGSSRRRGSAEFSSPKLLTSSPRQRIASLYRYRRLLAASGNAVATRCCQLSAAASIRGEKAFCELLSL